MSDTPRQKVLFLGWDAADWKVIEPLLEAGKMPYLEKILNAGVMGNIATLRPVLSPMLWTSIATGKHAHQHGILGFIEPMPDGSGIRPVTSSSRACKAIWNILSEQDRRTSVVGWFASHPSESIKGTCVSNLVMKSTSKSFEDWLLPDGVVQPESMREVIADLRVHPTEISPEQIVSMVPRAAEIDQEKDKRLATVAKLLADFHTIHNIGTYLAEHEAWDLLSIYYDSIDHFGHGFMKYRPPCKTEVSQADCEMYGEVIDHCYMLHDLALGRYMRIVGPDTTIAIVSDHGFHSDHLRPPSGSTILGEGFTHEHRDYGIFVAKGRNIKQDERVYGATLLDVTPTLLAMLGLPVAEDMDGKVLEQIFEKPPARTAIPSYEADDRTDEQEKEDPWASQAALEQLIELGYVEDMGDDAAAAIKRAKAQRNANLGRVHMSQGRFADAILAYEESMKYETFPTTKQRLAVCYLQEGRSDDCRRLVEEFADDTENTPYSRMLRGYLLYIDGRGDEAISILEEIEENDMTRPHLYLYRGMALAKLNRWSDARAAFEQAVDIDEESADALHGLGLALFHEQQYELAVEKLMRSVSLLHHQPKAHYHLGLALAATGQLDWAIQAMHVASSLLTSWPAPHEQLDLFYQARKDEAQAQLHRNLAAQLHEQNAAGVT